MSKKKPLRSGQHRLESILEDVRSTPEYVAAPNPNFKFQTSQLATDISEWSEWMDAHPSDLSEVDGYLVLTPFDHLVRVRVVFLPEES